MKWWMWLWVFVGACLLALLMACPPTMKSAVSASPVDSPTGGSQTVQGAITALSIKAPVPNMAVRVTNEKVLWMILDPHDTVVLHGGQVTPLDRLREGQRVKVVSAERQGKQVVKSIEVIEPLPAEPGARPAASS